MKKSNELVVKSNRLVEAGYRLTLVEQRVILLAIARARLTGRGINGEDFVRITAAEYARQFGCDESSAYLQLKEARKSLFNRQFVIYRQDMESGYREVIEARWLSAASYIDGAGAIQLQFSQAVVPYITRLESEFTRYKLERVAHMSSPYAIRLYELLMQWGSVGKREVELDWLRRILQLNDQYPSIKDLKKRVIDVAVAQINEHSDLTASYAQRKTGRNVTHFIFSFAPKPTEAEAEAAEVPDAVSRSPLFQRLRGHNIPAGLAREWVEQDAVKARERLDYAEAKARAGKLKGAVAPYLRSLFEAGAELGPTAFEEMLQAEARAAAQAEKRRQRAQAAADKATEERRLRAIEEADAALAWFEALPAERQARCEAEFKTQANPVDLGLFQQRGRACTGFRLFVKQAWAAQGAA